MKNYTPTDTYTPHSKPYNWNPMSEYYKPDDRGHKIKELQQELNLIKTMLKDKDILINTLIDKIVGLIRND